jgi:hypothetical protein
MDASDLIIALQNTLRGGGRSLIAPPLSCISIVSVAVPGSRFSPRSEGSAAHCVADSG